MTKKSSDINKEKVFIYGGNVLGGFLRVGNPLAGVFYGALDIANSFSKKLKESAFNRLSKALGAVYFSVSGVSDFLSAVNGNYTNLAELPFDVSMGYVLAKDAINLYRTKSLANDFSKVKDKSKELYKKAKPHVQDFKKSLEDKFNKSNKKGN